MSARTGCRCAAGIARPVAMLGARRGRSAGRRYFVWRGFAVGLEGCAASFARSMVGLGAAEVHRSVARIGVALVAVVGAQDYTVRQTSGLGALWG